MGAVLFTSFISSFLYIHNYIYFPVCALLGIGYTREFLVPCGIREIIIGFSELRRLLRVPDGVLDEGEPRPEHRASLGHRRLQVSPISLV